MGRSMVFCRNIPRLDHVPPVRNASPWAAEGREFMAGSTGSTLWQHGSDKYAWAKVGLTSTPRSHPVRSLCLTLLSSLYSSSLLSP